MLVRLMYTSRAAKPLDPEELQAILQQARANNPAQGVTGVLLTTGDLFVQVLEGGREAVNRLYNHIVGDQRHSEVTLLRYEEIRERRFAGWAMGQVPLARVNPALLLKYSESTTLNPYAMPGYATAALFDELVASAAVMCSN
ncbi:MAG: BLUF domain-containing protein [Burkholderiaceae bacterium]